MSDKSLEAVARVICMAEGYEPDRANARGVINWVSYVPAASAAIAAMPALSDQEKMHADEWGCYSIGHDAHTGGHSTLAVRNRATGEELIFTKAEVLDALTRARQIGGGQ